MPLFSEQCSPKHAEFLHIFLLLGSVDDTQIFCVTCDKFNASSLVETRHKRLGYGVSNLCNEQCLTTYQEQTLLQSITRGGGSFIWKFGNCSHFSLSQKGENHHRSCFHIATHMMVLYRSWANIFGTKLSKWNTKFARTFCEVIARKGLKFLATF